jgi:ribonuclease P protein subunit RPR2
MERSRAKPKWQKDIAKERIGKLLELAGKESKNPDRSDRYISMARKIAMRYNIKMSKEQKMLFCSKCHRYLKGSTRTKNKAVVSRCLKCNHIKRTPLKK